MNQSIHKEPMKNLAPDIPRQRLLIEGFYAGVVNTEDVVAYLEGIVQRLSLTAAAPPLVNDSTGMTSPQMEGIEAYQPLLESGISVYTWSHRRFMSLLIYTCREFSEKDALAFTVDTFGLHLVEHVGF